MTNFKEIRKLFDIWDNAFGCSKEEIVKCEKRLGTKLPETLRQYYLQLGNNDEINQTQDSLVLPSELKVYEDDFVVFYRENQSVWQAGLKFPDFDNENLNVYLSYDGKNWDFEIGSLHNFLTAEAFLQALFALPFNANRCEINRENEMFVRQNWKKCHFTSYLWQTEFFQNHPDEIIALMKSDNQTDIFIAARSEERFVEICEKLNIDWDYNNLEDE